MARFPHRSRKISKLLIFQQAKNSSKTPCAYALRTLIIHFMLMTARVHGKSRIHREEKGIIY